MIECIDFYPFDSITHVLTYNGFVFFYSDQSNLPID